VRLPFRFAYLLLALAWPAYPAGNVETGTPVLSLLQVVIALGIVLLAIVACAWVLRRLSPGNLGGRGLLRIVGAVMVGPKERVVLLELGDTWLLLGVAASNVSLLHTIPKPPASELPAESAQTGFSRLLSQAMARKRS
jgi:flagellar protein FliO/FliZ